MQQAIATALCRPSRQWQRTPPPAARTGIAASTPARNLAMGMGVSGESIDGACTHESGWVQNSSYGTRFVMLMMS
jgi:hypothetical protein